MTGTTAVIPQIVLSGGARSASKGQVLFDDASGAASNGVASADGGTGDGSSAASDFAALFAQLGADAGAVEAAARQDGGGDAPKAGAAGMASSAKALLQVLAANEIAVVPAYAPLAEGQGLRLAPDGPKASAKDAPPADDTPTTTTTDSQSPDLAGAGAVQPIMIATPPVATPPEANATPSNSDVAARRWSAPPSGAIGQQNLSSSSEALAQQNSPPEAEAPGWQRLSPNSDATAQPDTSPTGSAPPPARSRSTAAPDVAPQPPSTSASEVKPEPGKVDAQAPAARSPSDRDQQTTAIANASPAMQDNGAAATVRSALSGLSPAAQMTSQATAGNSATTPERRTETTTTDADTTSAEATAAPLPAPTDGTRQTAPAAQPPRAMNATAQPQPQPQPQRLPQSPRQHTATADPATTSAFTFSAAEPSTSTAATDSEPLRDPTIMAAARITAVHQETNFVPAVPQSPAAQIADRITRDLNTTPTQATAASQTDATIATGQTVKVLHLQLNPADLGPLTIRMSLKQDTLEVHVEAAQHDTARLIERDRETLSSLLRSAGYAVDRLTVQAAPPDSSTASSSTFTGSGTHQQPSGQGQATGWQQEHRGSARPGRDDGNSAGIFGGNGNDASDTGVRRNTGSAVYL